MTRVEIPGLGPVTIGDDPGEYISEPLPVPVLGNVRCRLLVAGYDGDERPADFHEAIRAFLTLDEAVLRAAGGPIFEYYEDVRAQIGDEQNFPSIAGPDELWDHIQPGTEAWIERDGHLQVVFRGGRSVTKVGQFDGHLTNEGAYADDTLAGVVYHRLG